MILAAGRGERLRPLTDRTPKPLIEVGGKPLIAHHLERLAGAGFDQVVVNLAWLGEQIEQALGDGSSFGVDIAYSREPAGALETAGGIIHALPLLGNQPFLMISADVFCDYPLDRLRSRPLQGLGHLVLVENPAHHEQGDFALDAQSRLVNGAPAFTFSGLALLHPALFHGLAPGRLALRPVFEQAMENESLTGELYQGIWSDVGTADRLAAIRRQIAT
ncbi:nucleotidyltransferase family protein [Wenzhouxiangella sp. C33]|uniref:Nucleotidyltransferase family protein n=2 Tax=Wenzhouxiangella limi TaxID=2707351 RepID=A0A845V1T8_9GAMM|nr:nucleotidyltransferase family protein [Wenzhouxiangella limi]